MGGQTASDTTPAIKVVHETPSTAVVDGDSGLGLVIAPKQWRLLFEKATQVGTGWVAVKNSNHFGYCGISFYDGIKT
ncbi:MAG: Ldh family oxidoreductase [Cytophagales bacterium]|nr:Ldh family oxidoreductase [Cytophagales bacterium]